LQAYDIVFAKTRASLNFNENEGLAYMPIELSKQFVRAQPYFASVLVTQSTARDEHFLSVHDHEALFPAPPQRLTIRSAMVFAPRQRIGFLLDRQQDHT
jgi:hypothetical protein